MGGPLEARQPRDCAKQLGKAAAFKPACCDRNLLISSLALRACATTGRLSCGPSHPASHSSCLHPSSLPPTLQANVLRFATTMELTAGFSLVLSILGSGLRGAMLAYV